MDTMSQLDRSLCEYMHLSLLVVNDLQLPSQHLVHLNGQKKIVQYQILSGDGCLPVNPVPVCRLQPSFAHVVDAAESIPCHEPDKGETAVCVPIFCLD